MLIPSPAILLLHRIIDDKLPIPDGLDGLPGEGLRLGPREAEALEEAEPAVDDLVHDSLCVRRAVLGLAAAAQVEDVAEEAPPFGHHLHVLKLVCPHHD